MPVDPEYIEQLVLEEISGTISPEDSATLKQLLEQEPEAYAIWQEMHRQLTGSYVQSVRENLSNTLPVEHIIATARRRKRRKIVVWSTGVAASLLALMVVYKVMQPAFQPVSPAPIPLFALKSVALQLPDGHRIYLGSWQQQQEIDGIIFRETAGKLSWSGAGTGAQLSTLMVPAGKDYTVRLPDGSEVTLNAGTTMQLPLAFGSTRDVTINGEAYLAVAKDEQKPFRVHLPKSSVEVLGTSFNVNTYDSGQVKVALESGAVRMLTNDGDLLLQPGEILHYQPGRQPAAVKADMNALLSWKSGYYTFKNTPISVISGIIARNYGVRVVLGSKETANRLYSSRLEKREDIRKFLDRLKLIDDIDYQFEKGDSVLHLLYRP
jgi:ferric-dicitrate binding protein FerR (iron transport regulator)